MDFFGVSVKASDLLTRVEELQLLAKRISHYKDPIKQFRVLSYLKPSNWSKGCGWNQSMCFVSCFLFDASLTFLVDFPKFFWLDLSFDYDLFDM